MAIIFPNGYRKDDGIDDCVKEGKGGWGDALSVMKSERTTKIKEGGKRGMTWRLDFDLFERVEVLFKSGVFERGEVG